MLVSFIIPAYNAADTIVRCLESVYGLSLKREEFEVIVIDDASSDNTVEVIEQYCQKVKTQDSRVKNENLILLKQSENMRQGAARNRGVKVAKGEYICFVDADDVVADGLIKAIRSAVDNKTDMTAYNYAFVNELGKITKEADRLSFEEGQLFSGIELQNRHPYWCSGPVAYVYKREFMEQVNYPFVEGVLFEDADFVMTHLYYAIRMTYSSELGYKAFYRDGSTTHQSTTKSVADYLFLGMRMFGLYNQAKDNDEQFAQSILEGACFNVAMSCKRLMKLSSLKDACAYYERVDERISRHEIYNNQKLRTYYWNVWTSLCMKHKRITILLLAILMPIYSLVKWRKV